MLSSDEAARYWENRHRQRGLMRSGGHVSRLESENLAFYLERVGLISRLLGGMGGGAARAELLDAGCGKGVFSGLLADCGFRVTGIDASGQAVNEATSRLPALSFEQTSLAAYRPAHFFDAAIVIDVLFHILDDEEWEASILNIAKLVRFGGMLLVSDGLVQERSNQGQYVRFRPRSDYDVLLGTMDYRAVDAAGYGEGDSAIGLYSFIRS